MLENGVRNVAIDIGFHRVQYWPQIFAQLVQIQHTTQSTGRQ